MALSEYEKQVLAEMEQELRKADPDLADVMASSLPEVEPELPKPVSKPPLSPRRIAVGSILVAIGLVVVLAGMSFSFSVWTILLGAAGFLTMVGGVLYALTPDKAAKPSARADGSERKGKTREQKDTERRQRWEGRGR